MDKLLRIQQKLKAPKNQRNSFGGYNYRSCEDILEAVKPILEEEKCVITISDEIVGVADRVYVKATVSLISTDDGHIIASTTAFAREEESKKGMDGSQITGASSSYARKYALNGLFCIDDNKDSDVTNTHDNNEVSKEVANQKRKDTIEKNKEIEKMKETKEYALQRLESGIAFVKKLKQINPAVDKATMDAIDQVKELLMKHSLVSELEEFNKLINSKIVQDDGDVITY